MHSSSTLNNYSARAAVQGQLMRLMAVLLFAIALYRASQGLGLSQLAEPPFIRPQADNLSWLLHYCGWPQFLLGNSYAALAVDLGLLALPLLMWRYPRRWGFNLAYLFLAFCYYMSFNSAATHHEHKLVLAMGIAFLLCFKNVNTFTLLFKALRFYACFVLFSAALWKIGRGSIGQADQLYWILLEQHGAGLLVHQNTAFAEWLIAQPTISTILWWAATFVELVFVIGWFSRKFDYWLFGLFWVFLIMDYGIMGLSFWSLGIGSLCFWPYCLRRLDC